MEKSKRPIVIWLLTGCLMIYGMVVIGGITRLTHSGLSMVNWTFIGSFPPMTKAQWQVPFDAYKHSPEYLKINHQFNLAEFKSIYWWEYIHRTLGRLIGVVFLLPFFYFLFRKKFDPLLLKKVIVLFFLGMFQGLLGWYMVSSGLINNPHVSHYRLAAHLMSALTVFSFTFWVALDLLFPNNQVRDKKLAGLKKLSYFLLGFLALQIMYGAFVAGLRAGNFDPTWPKMGSNWIAPEITALTPLWKNFVDGVAGVQFIHRYNAYVVVALVIAVWFKSRKLVLTPMQKKGVNFLLIMVFVQFLLGVFTLINQVPVVLGVLHQTGAFFLLCGTLFFMHQLSVRPVTEMEEKKVAGVTA